MCTINGNHMYGPWNMDRNRHSFFVIFGHFFPFYPINYLKNQNLKKKNNNKRHHHLHLCTTNDNQMIYVSWDMECGWQNYLSIWAIFYLLTPVRATKTKMFKNWKQKKQKKNKKKTRRDIILLKCAKNHDHMLYFSWDMVRDGCNFYFHFVLFSCRFTAWKNKKKIQIK